MTKGKLLVLVALILTAATALLASRIDTFDDLVLRGPPMVSLVVSEVDIPAGTDLDQLIKDHRFKSILVPPNHVPASAVSSIDQLMHRRTMVAILANELILPGYLKYEAG